MSAVLWTSALEAVRELRWWLPPIVSLVVLCLAFCLEPYLSVPFVSAAGRLCQLACCLPSAASGFGIV